MIDDTIDKLDDIEAQIATLKAEKERLEKELIAEIQPEILQQLKEKDYGCGTATVETVNFKIKTVVSKKVTWDQDQLSDLAEKIKASGDDPLEYLKIKFDVSETAYKNWPSKIQAAFEPARSVEQSKPKITWERI